MFAPLWEIKLLRTGKYGEERREKRPNRGGTPGEKAETGRKSGRKATPGGTPSVEAATGRNAGRSDQNGEKRREKRTTGRDRGGEKNDGERPGRTRFGLGKTGRGRGQNEQNDVLPAFVPTIPVRWGHAPMMEATESAAVEFHEIQWRSG